jgi:chromate transporter
MSARTFPNPPLREIAFLFLKLGFTAFGGPAAHIAMMEEEVVKRRGWISREKFLDLLGATQMIPGPNSTEMAIHIGYERGGWPGLFVAGICFISPAVMIVTALACFYVRYQSLPEAQGILYGMKPAVLAVIFLALWRLGRSAIKTACGATLFYFLGTHELIVLFATAFVVAAAAEIRRFFKEKLKPGFHLFAWGSAPFLIQPQALVSDTPANLQGIFLIFLKIGSVLFGSGYVLLAFLKSEFVQRLHWLSETQLMDAVAVGQITPGPLFTTATFVGYLMAGFPGAAVATLGIFLPAFIFVAASGPLIPKLRKSRVAGKFLDGLNVASLALMAGATIVLSHDAVRDIPGALIAAGSLILLIFFKLSASWLIPLSGLLGILAQSLLERVGLF